MKIVVLGLWHLGSVTAACCARHFQVSALDFDPGVVEGLRAGRLPVYEPGLAELIGANQAAGRLEFFNDPAAACLNAEILWLTCDTPVNEEDESDAGHVLEQLRRALPFMTHGALVLISSQLPAGTCAGLEGDFPGFHFACSPENLRLGRALDAFENADRAVVGIRSQTKVPLLEILFKPFTKRIIFMRTESAEMVKHALNGFLALSITFINEIARLSEHVGADAGEVAAGLKSDARIGARAYLGPGSAFAGGTLARDVVALTRLGEKFKERILVIPAIKESNDAHGQWAFERLAARFGGLRGREFAVLGLTYTPDTNTLRRSAAIELCWQLHKAGASVRAFDPAIAILPEELSFINLGSLAAVLNGADAAIVCTGLKELRQASWPGLILGMRQPVVIDANRFLDKEMPACPGVEHLSVGRVL